VANAGFIAWLTINLIGRGWGEAHSRAQVVRHDAHIRRGWFTVLLSDLLFFYVPANMRSLMRKDLRTFSRDATQWMQMVIMLGLLVVYAINLKRLPMDLSNPGMRGLIAFLNITTVSLILATFTSRFIFPLLSLESQQMWLLGLLPMKRGRILLAKFLFALTLTSLSAMLVMGLSVAALELSWEWTQLQLGITLSVCIGLSGLSVGLGARFPVFGERNPARIAAGFGGTVNLIISMLFVSLMMTGCAMYGLAQIGSRTLARSAFRDEPELLMISLLAGGPIVAAISLWIGRRHFERLET
jgi:ABC-2 type transport system permease protein